MARDLWYGRTCSPRWLPTLRSSVSSRSRSAHYSGGWSKRRVIAVAALPAPILVAAFGVLIFVLNLLPPTNPDALTDINGVPHHTDAYGLILLPLALAAAAIMIAVGGAVSWAIVKVLSEKER